MKVVSLPFEANCLLAETSHEHHIIVNVRKVDKSILVEPFCVTDTLTIPKRHFLAFFNVSLRRYYEPILFRPIHP
jgi:hypothetical protein